MDIDILLPYLNKNWDIIKNNSNHESTEENLSRKGVRQTLPPSTIGLQKDIKCPTKIIVNYNHKICIKYHNVSWGSSVNH